MFGRALVLFFGGGGRGLIFVSFLLCCSFTGFRFLQEPLPSNAFFRPYFPSSSSCSSPCSSFSSSFSCSFSSYSSSCFFHFNLSSSFFPFFFLLLSFFLSQYFFIPLLSFLVFEVHYFQILWPPKKHINILPPVFG